MKKKTIEEMVEYLYLREQMREVAQWDKELKEGQITGKQFVRGIAGIVGIKIDDYLEK